MAEKQRHLTHADLLAMSQSELDDLYRGLGAGGSIPVGDTQGTAIILPGRRLGRIFRTLARLFWQGKVFDSERRELANKISVFQFKAIRAKVYRGESWMDEGEAIILDYSTTSIVARWIRDEIREVSSGLWLGKAFLWKWHVLDFTLTN